MVEEKSFLLKSKDALFLYGKYIYSAGHCPVCGDFLFVDIYESEGDCYKVIRECVSTDCNYNVDVSDEFNEKLGLKKPSVDEGSNSLMNHSLHISTLKMGDERRIRRVPSVYYETPYSSGFYSNEIESNGNVPPTTGHLEISFDKEGHLIRKFK